MKKAIGYIRVSTSEQAAEGVSLAAQEAKIRAYCELNDLELVELISDAGLSAKTTNRAGLIRAMTALEAGEAAALVVYKLDRLSRKTADTLNLIETIEAAGAAFHSIAEKVDTRSPMGRFFLTITAAFAQMERDTIAERTREALSHKQAVGEHVGSAPYGSQIENKVLTADVTQTAVIAQIVELRAAGHTLRAIADRLNANNVPTQRGGIWQASTIKKIIDRAA